MNYFDKNIEIMRTRDPKLAALLCEEIDCSHIEVLPSSHPDVPTAQVTIPSGDKVLLHNMSDPIGSAERSAEKHEMTGANASILLGFGLGYLARELASKSEKKHLIIVCEVDTAILKTAMTHVDLTPVLDSDYIKILTGQEIPLQEWIMNLSFKFMTAEVKVICFEPAIAVHPEAYQQLKEVAQKESLGIILNRNTTLKAGQRMLENVLNNFPDVIQSAGVTRLENLFQGRPAILVAAGPSLEKNVHLLRELDGRAVIIAVDTSLRLLLPLGIKPDIVTTIDFNQKNFEKFANVPIDSDISLVYHPGGYHESIQAFHGPKFTQSRVSNRIPAWLMQYVEDKGVLPSGTTVAHLSFHLACHLGCEPIVFIGQDLAFPKNQIHAGDLSLWQIDLQDMEMVEDIFGDPVGSMTSFKHAIYHFEKAFKETQATIIDATEAGAKKQGSRVMRLRDVIDAYGKGPQWDIKGMLKHAGEDKEAVRMEELLRDMEYVSSELGLIQKDCREVEGVVRKLARKIEKGETEDDQFVKMTILAEKMTEAMNQKGRVLHLMGEENYALELYMMQHKISSIDELEEVDKKIAQQVERAKIYYPSVARAAVRFKKPLDRLIHRLTRAYQLSKLAMREVSTVEDWYLRGLAYSRIEYRQDAILSLNQALVHNPHHVPTLKLIARLYLDTNRIEDALQTMERLRHLLKKPDRAVSALEEAVQEKNKAWQERCTRLRVEFSEKSQELSLEEAGWFYYRAKDYPMAIVKLERAVSENPTFEAFKSLGYARLAAGNMDAAVEAWVQGLAMDPHRPDLYKELGMLTLEHGLMDQAEQFLHEAVRIDPDDMESCERLAQLYMAREAFMEAGTCYENLLRLSPQRLELIPQIATLYQRQISSVVVTQ